MPLPDVEITVNDPGLGLIIPSAGRTQVKVGVCSAGAPNVLQGFGSSAAAKAGLGSGPLLDAVVQALDVGGGPVLAMPVALPPGGGGLGTVSSSLALSGIGTGTIAGGRVPETPLRVKIIAGGSPGPGAMTFQTAIGDGVYSATRTSGAAPYHYTVPGAYFTDLVFAAGTYVANDVYTVGVDGVVVRTGAGPATALNTSAHSPVDSYDLKVKILTAGAPGVAAFAYSLDGGRTYSAQIAVPPGGAYVITGTGVMLTFAGTFTVGDVYAGAAVAAGYSGTELNAALEALMLDPAEWGFLHVVGKAADPDGARAMAEIVDGQLVAAEASFRYAHGIVECPQEDGDADIKTAFADFVSSRVGIAAGDCYLTSRITGKAVRRNCAWPITARLGAIKLSKNPAAVNLGALKNVRGILRDERQTPGLDPARFMTLRTFVGTPGFFLGRYLLMALPGSDFHFGMYRRVMDRTCQLARNAYLKFVGDDVRIDRETGHIDERDAQVIDALVRGELLAGLVDEDEVSDVDAVVSRDDNLLSSPILHAEVSIFGKAYLDGIAAGIGFVNPALG